MRHPPPHTLTPQGREREKRESYGYTGYTGYGGYGGYTGYAISGDTVTASVTGRGPEKGQNIGVSA